MRSPKAVQVATAPGLPLPELMGIVMAEGVFPVTFTLDMCRMMGFALQDVPDDLRRRAIVKLCNSVSSIRGAALMVQETRMIDAFIEGWCETEPQAN